MEIDTEPPPADTTIADLLTQITVRARELGIPGVIYLQGLTLWHNTPNTTEAGMFAAIHDLEGINVTL
jgi:hypothetical protein